MRFLFDWLKTALLIGAVFALAYIALLAKGEPPVELDLIIPGPAPTSPEGFTPPLEHAYTCDEDAVVISVEPDTPNMRQYAAWECAESARLIAELPWPTR